MSEQLLKAIDLTRQALLDHPKSHWIIGFSGGKDSTALLRIFVSAARKVPKCPPVDVIYCDTGVENPVLDQYVKDLFSRLQSEFVLEKLSFNTHLLSAPVAERFFVKIVGRGYPPPTNSFRWCTKNLRIKPVSRFIADATEADAIVALGLRRLESGQRDRSIRQNGNDHWQFQQEGGKRYRLFLPILEMSVPEVWDSIFMLPYPRAVQPHNLERLYRGASGECPIIKSPQAAPCSSGRFGCWTCTVVRRDRSSESLIRAGHENLRPFLKFRDWLSHIRNDPWRRWPIRRNGSIGLGPFTLETRREILAVLRRLEDATCIRIIQPGEIEEILRLWDLDTEIEPSARLGRKI